MKIISWNVNGIRSVYKKGFLDWIKNEDPDILCLQEIKSDRIPISNDMFAESLDSKYHIVLNSASKKGYSGVSVFSKDRPIRVTNNLGMERFDDEGRYLEIQFLDFSLINLYVPHGARDKRNLGYKLSFYRILGNVLKNRTGDNLILCGDFNVAHKTVDLTNPKNNVDSVMFTENERLQIDKIVGLGFVDSFRKYHKEGGQYSWWPYGRDLRKRNIGWRIDYIFVSEPLNNKLENAFILPEVLGSDHAPVGIILNK